VPGSRRAWCRSTAQEYAPPGAASDPEPEVPNPDGEQALAYGPPGLPERQQAGWPEPAWPAVRATGPYETVPRPEQQKQRREQPETALGRVLEPG